MSQRTPKICQPRGKIVIPIEDGECLYWLIPVDTKDDIENPTRDFAWIDKRGVMYVFDGSKIVPINDPDLLKVRFENILGSPYDNGPLTTELNKRVQTIKMNNGTVPMDSNGVVDLGCVTTCEDLDNAIAGIETMHVEVVDELPEQGDKEVIYLVPQSDSGYILECHEYEFVDGVVQWVTPTNALNVGNGGKCNVTVAGNTYQSTASVTETQTTLQFDNGVITSTLNADDTYTLKIELNGVSGTETVCVKSEEDTVYTMYVWYENAYKQVGDERRMAVETKKDWQENGPNSAKYIENRTHYLNNDGTVKGLDKKYILDALKDSITIHSGTVETSSVISIEPLIYARTRYEFPIDPEIAGKVIGVTQVALSQSVDEDQLIMSDVLRWDIRQNENRIIVIVRNYTPRTTTQTKTISIHVTFKYLKIE